MEKINLKIVSIVQTCHACPSQWEAVLDDGRHMYIRYRWGYLSVRVSPIDDMSIEAAVGGEEVWGQGTGESCLDGVIELAEVLLLTGLTYDGDGDEKGEDHAVHSLS